MKTRNGFTLIEMLVYIGVLTVIIAVIASFFLWASRSFSKTKAIQETSNNGQRAMEIIISEIREASGIYTSTSTSTQLSLTTSKYLPDGETSSYLDIFLCQDQICLKKESQPAVALTSNNVRVSNLSFTRINSTSTALSIQVAFTVDYKTSSQKPELKAAFSSTSTAAIRTY